MPLPLRLLTILSLGVVLLHDAPRAQAQQSPAPSPGAQGQPAEPFGVDTVIVVDTASTEPTPVDSIAAAKRESIRQMMRLTQAEQMAQQVMARTLLSMRQRQPHVPDDWWQRFARKIDTGALMERLVPIYAEHFTHDEIKQIIAFYETPLGQKVIRQMPAIMQKSMTVGEQWGQRLTRELMRELKEDDYVET